MRAYSEDLRKKIVAAVERGMSKKAQKGKFSNDFGA
jgi:DNA invertase Pin-like site-specific DNA recombinase